MKSNSKILLTAALLMTALSHGPAAHATPTLDLSFSARHSELFSAGGDVMRIFFDNGAARTTAYVKAGMFSGVVEGAEDFDPATLYLSEDNVLVYCVDILQGLRRARTSYEVNEIGRDQVVNVDGTRRDFGRMLDFLGAVNEVLAGDGYNLVFGDRNWLHPNAGWMSGAIQAGIWESLYEEEDSVLSIGNNGSGAGSWFSATGVDARAVALLDAAFGRMDTAAPLSVEQVKWLATAQGQDLVADPVDVPAPAPLLLLLGALGWRILSRRKALAGPPG